MSPAGQTAHAPRGIDEQIEAAKTFIPERGRAPRLPTGAAIWTRGVLDYRTTPVSAEGRENLEQVGQGRGETELEQERDDGL